MGTVDTALTPEIIKPGGEGESSCELQWEINREDNNDESTYYVGSTYSARLYLGSDIQGLNTFSTNGSLFGRGTGRVTRTEQITFSGSANSSLSSVYDGGFSSQIIGQAYSLKGRRINPSFFAVFGHLLVCLDLQMGAMRFFAASTL